MTKPNLTDPAAVEALLRMVLHDATKILTGPILGQSGMIDSLCRETARILLGYEKVMPVVGWNAPGGIDEHCARVLGLTETGPQERMEAVVLRAIDELGIPAGVSGRTGHVPADWPQRLEAVVAKYLPLLIAGTS